MAQKIIDSNFGNATSGDVLFVVVSADNVTTPEVHAFVSTLSSTAATDRSLSNLTGVTSVYGSASDLVEGAVSAERSFRNATILSVSFFYGIPDTFLRVWNQSFGIDPSEISAATNATAGVLAEKSTPQQANSSMSYLRAFSAALAASYGKPGVLPVDDRITSVVRTIAPEIISSSYPTEERPLVLLPLQSLSIGNYSSPTAIESAVVKEVVTQTLFTPTFASRVYPLSVTPSAANESSVVDSLIANPSSFDLPAVYQNAVNSFVSSDHKTMLVVLSFKGVTEGDVISLRSLLATLTPSFGLDPVVSVTGSVALDHDFSEASLGDLGIILPVTVIVLIAATGIFFRSVVTPGVSLLAIGVALGIANTAILYLVSTYLVGIDPNISSILLTVIIGVGTDYSVFLLARYREERVRGKDRDSAVLKSVSWAGESIATSGLTVIISFIFLALFSSVPFLKGIGFAVGGGVLVALLGSLTLVPSIIMMLPNLVFWPNVGKRFASYSQTVEAKIMNKTGYFSRSAKFSIKHAKVVTVVALLATVPAAYTWGTNPVGYDFLAAAPKNLESVAAFNNLTQSFGAGTIYPTYAVVKFASPVWNGSGYDLSEMKIIDFLTNTTLHTNNVKEVTGPTTPGGERVDYTNLGSDPRSRLLEKSINSMINRNGTLVLMNIDFKDSPQSETSLETAQQLRNEYQSLVNNNPSLQAVYLGGVAGSTLDSKNTVNAQFEQIIAYVMIGVAAVLLLVLGSLFLPLFAIVSIVLSITWTLATTGLVFQHFYNFPLLFITPLALFVLLLGLGMDYNIFILTRIREEASKGVSLEAAITTAIERTGGIITAAALILAGSLGALMISNNLLLKEFGFAFFYSIIIDAMIMRTYVVPSVMTLMGKWNFYAPGKLQRVRVNAPGTE
jgi:RND superfamily putative drug exporter